MHKTEYICMGVVMKVLVVGGGVIGVTSAYELAKAGYDVSLVEANSDTALETSFANGGLLTPSMSDPWNAPGIWKDLIRYIGKANAPMLLRLKALPSLALWGMHFLKHSAPPHFNKALLANTSLSLLSMQVMRELIAQTPLDFELNTGGVLKVYRDTDAFMQGIHKMEKVAETGVVTETLHRDALLTKEPSLRAIGHELVGGLYFPNDMSGNAALFTQALAAKLAASEAQVLYEETAEQLLLEKSAIKAVKTSKGIREADHVVLACGSWTGKLLTPLWRGLPVKPVKGYSLTLQKPKDSAFTSIPRLPIVDDGLHAAITPLGNRIRVAGTAEFTGFDRRLTKERLLNLQDLLHAILPDVADDLLSGDCQNWCGFRPVSADGMPFIGATPIEGLYLNTGHGAFGWTMAMGSARMLAQIMTGKKPDIENQCFSPTRAWTA